MSNSNATYRSHKKPHSGDSEEAELEVQRALWIRPHAMTLYLGVRVIGQEVEVCDMGAESNCRLPFSP